MAFGWKTMLRGLSPDGTRVVPGTRITVLAGQRVLFQHDQGLYGIWNGELSLASDVECEVLGDPKVEVRADGTWALTSLASLLVRGSGHGTITDVQAGVSRELIGQDLVLFPGFDRIMKTNLARDGMIVVREVATVTPPPPPPVDYGTCPDGTPKSSVTDLCVGHQAPPPTTETSNTPLIVGGVVAAGVLLFLVTR